MFKLKFSTDNDAFSEGDRGYEIAQILRALANVVEASGDGLTTAGRSTLDGLPIFDINGNRIGSVSDAIDY